MEEEINSKNSELQRINAQIETSNKLLVESKARVEKEQLRLRVKQKNLDQFIQVSNALALYEYPELSGEYGNVARAMIDFKKLGYDSKIIVSKYQNMMSLIRANEKLEAKLQKSESVLESYSRKREEEEARWKDYYNALEMFNTLVKDGLRMDDIFDVVHVLKNDFPQRDIQQLIEDIRTYGSIAAATWKLQRHDEENESLW
ncbi:MAG: hypothetical protein ACR2KF_04425 [Nitrososphaeraceae archaeon]